MNFSKIISTVSILLILTLSSNAINTGQQHKNAENDTLKMATDSIDQSKTGSTVYLGQTDFRKNVVISPDQLLKGMIPGLVMSTENGIKGMQSGMQFRGATSYSNYGDYFFSSNKILFVVDGVMLDSRDVWGMRNPLNFINPKDITSIRFIKDGPELTKFGARAANGVVVINTKRQASKKIEISYNGDVSLTTIKDRYEPYSANEFRNQILEHYGAEHAATDYLGSANTDWQDQIYENRINTNHHLSIYGKPEKINIPYQFSYGYTSNKDIINTSSVERNSINANLNPRFFDNHLRFNINLKGSFHNNQLPEFSAPISALKMNPTQPVYEPGNDFGGFHTTTQPDGSFTPQAPPNPVALLDQTKHLWNVNRLLTAFNLAYDVHFLPELTINLSYSRDASNADGSFRVEETAGFNGSGNDVKYEQTRKNSIIKSGLTYKKHFNTIHSTLELSAFGNMQEFNDIYFRQEFDDWTNQYMTEEYTSNSHTTSLAFQLKYNFKKKYFLNVVGNHEQTSLLTPENRGRLFPAAGIGWSIHKENFMNNLTFLSNLHAKVSYSETSSFFFSNNAFNFEQIYSMHANLNDANPSYELTYPVTKSRNFALDFGFLNQRITGSIEIYQRKTDSLIQATVLWNGADLYYVLSNKGQVENKGYEVSLSGSIISKKDMEWQLGGFIAHNESILKNIHDDSFYGYQTGVISGGIGSMVQINSNNYPVNSFYLYEQIYDDNGNPIEGLFVDQNNDGVITEEDRAITENPSPAISVGLQTNITYKKINLKITALARKGNYVYNNIASTMNVNQFYNPMGYLENKLPGSSNFDNYNYFSDHYIEDASFFKIETITLGYNLKIQKQLPVYIYTTVANPIIFTNYSGINPEAVYGTDNSAYPSTTTFILGVSLNF